MEPTEFNLRRQCGGGEALRDSATLLEVLCSGEVIGPDKRTMQSFALINVKVPPQNPTAAVFLPRVFFLLSKKKVYSPNGIGNHRSSSHWSDSRSVITRPALHPLSFCQSHSVTLLILYVTTLTLFWLDALNVHCVVALQIAHDSLPIRAFVSYLWVGIWYALKINCFIL